MPRVLILGGAGYIGLGVSQALLRSGNHTVFATTRTSDKTNLLTTNEITAIQGDATDSNFLTDTIANHHIDVVIDTTQAYEQSGKILASIVNAARERASGLDGAVGPRLGFIYTSGSWIHGSPSRRVSDLTVPGTALSPDKPGRVVSWRPAHEQAVLAARDVLDVAILRPGSVYGRGSWVFSTWWDPLLEAAANEAVDKPVSIMADENTRNGVVHLDDLGAAYVSVVEKINGQLGSWPVFELTTETVPVNDLLRGVAAVLGVKREIRYEGTRGNAFLEALSLCSNTDSSRARAILGWDPKRRDIIQNLPTIVAAWKASKS
ncbi:NAD(P)-binding protein [Poronia punctata]|nr:NAD(P)-binding protein [Poronia punctata]